jgi:hypothetical protein
LIASIILVWNVAEAFRSPGINVLATFIWMLLGALLMVTVGTQYGVEGIAFSRLAVTILTMPMIIIVERRYLGRFMAGHWLSLLLRVAAAAAVLALVEWSVSRAIGTGWFAFIAAGTSGCIAYALTLFGLRFFTPDEIAQVRSLVGRTV